MKNVIKKFLSQIGASHASLLNPPTNNIPVLDVLRSLAILLVVCGHAFGEYSNFYLVGPSVKKFFFFHYGWAGVDLFFVLSGYLIGRQAWKEHMKEGQVNVLKFLFRRGLRIWPYYFSFLAFKLFIIDKMQMGWSRLWPDIFFLSNYKQGIVSGAWSLSTEEQFYIILPLLFVCILTRIPIKKHWIVLVPLFLSQPLTRWILLIVHDGSIRDGNSSIFYQPIHTHADGLLAGLILAWLGCVYPQCLKKWHWFKNLSVFFGISLIAVFLRQVDGNIFAFFSLALIFTAATFCSLKDQTLFSKIAEFKFFFILSRLSYAMYLNHFVIVPKFIPWITGYFKYSSLALIAAVLGTILVSMGISWVTYNLIEYPFLQWREVIIKGWGKKELQI